MTAAREEFEAWFSDGLPAPLRRNGEEYVFVAVQSAWDAWQAAHLAGQQAMRERAAKLIEGTSSYSSSPNAVFFLTKEARQEQAASIRALEVKPS